MFTLSILHIHKLYIQLWHQPSNPVWTFTISIQYHLIYCTSFWKLIFLKSSQEWRCVKTRGQCHCCNVSYIHAISCHALLVGYFAGSMYMFISIPHVAVCHSWFLTKWKIPLLMFQLPLHCYSRAGNNG